MWMMIWRAGTSEHREVSWSLSCQCQTMVSQQSVGFFVMLQQPIGSKALLTSVDIRFMSCWRSPSAVVHSARDCSLPLTALHVMRLALSGKQPLLFFAGRVEGVLWYFPFENDEETVPLDPHTLGRMTLASHKEGPTQQPGHGPLTQIAPTQMPQLGASQRWHATQGGKGQGDSFTEQDASKQYRLVAECPTYVSSLLDI